LTWWNELRQWRFPPELRIPAPGEAPLEASVEELRALLAPDPPPAPTRESDPGPAEDQSFLIDLANALFKVRERAEAVDGIKGERLRSRADDAARILQAKGVEIVDFTGRRFDANEYWDDVEAATGDKANPMIVGMRKPRILIGGVAVQSGIPRVEDVIEDRL